MRYIVKPDPEIDFYALVCTNVGDFLDGGPRAEWDTWWEERPGDFAPERFDRADAHGTSAYDRDYGWAETSIFLNRGTSEGWMLERSNIIEYLRRKDAGEPVNDLLTPCADDGE